MEFIKDLLSENGTVSTVRLMSLISLLTGCGIAAYAVIVDKNPDKVVQIVSVFVGAAFTSKVAQKMIEK
jgi:hypothetical protein